MPYKLVIDDATPTEALRRIAEEELGAAQAAAQAARGDTLIHDLRKTVKKTRALLRLVRPNFKPFKTENAALALAAEGISGVRDAEVMRATLARLGAERHDPAHDPEGAEAARRLLAALPHDHATPDPAALARFADRIGEIRDRARHWKVHKHGWNSYAPGLIASYDQARTRMALARDTGADAALHSWRSRVKHHWYQARLLAPIWPEMMAPVIAAADRLGETLGDHHDLSVLCDALDGPLGAHLPQPAALIRLARARQARLETEAFGLGARLFAEDPTALAHRWGLWFALWRTSPEQAGPDPDNTAPNSEE